MTGKSDVKMKDGDLRCGLQEFVAGKSDMEMTVCDLRCGLPELVAGKSDIKMQNASKSYFSVQNK